MHPKKPIGRVCRAPLPPRINTYSALPTPGLVRPQPSGAAAPPYAGHSEGLSFRELTPAAAAATAGR